MKSYLSYFKLKFKIGLQYRAAAIAGISTQLFFGIVYILVYLAFYESDISNIPMPLDQLISYLWLVQAFFSIVYLWYKDKDIINLIKTGNIAYELCRPQDVYMMWFSKIYGERLANLALRCFPVLLFAILLPKPYNLNLKIPLIRFMLFIVIILLSTILMTLIVLLYHVICLFTLDEKGIVNIFMVISDILSGFVIPLPFFPVLFQKLAYILPFRYVSDFPFRFYVGNISFNEGINGLVLQLLWIIIIYIIGRVLIKKALKKVVVQGG